MNESTSTASYICPICQNLLVKQSAYICENNHCFDIAKQGYVNLLPVQQKKSKHPGDNKIMIQKRKFFLEQGFYHAITSHCVEIIKNHSIENKTITILDIGCGDGYFTRNIVDNSHTPVDMYGLDISKEAIKIAAKSSTKVQWLVASSKIIPLANNSIDIILKINSPLDYQSTKQKLSNHGIIISVVPGSNHLKQLKSHIYDTVKLHEPEKTPDGYNLAHQDKVHDTLVLENNQTIDSLFKMTPYFWNASSDAKQHLEKLVTLETEIAFDFNVWRPET